MDINRTQKNMNNENLASVLGTVTMENNLKTKRVTITAKKDLYNYGKCFTKGKSYTTTTERDITSTHSLSEVFFMNDLNQMHCIGNWHKEFTYTIN